MMFKKFVFSAVLGVSLVVSAHADQPKPFPEFSAKRVKPPKSGVGKRITIQIDPAAQTKPAPSPAPTRDLASVAPAQPGRYAWFWDKVSADAANSGPGRLDQAMRALASNGSVASPRLQNMQVMAQTNGIDILRHTVGTNVSPALVLAVMAVESAGNPKAESRAGAQGLMQLMPDTAARFGVSDSFVPSQNIAGGVKYLNWLMETFKNDPILVLAGYNAGEGNVRTHGGVPPFAETRDYVPKVLAAFQVARGLCITPPELISDGCVFATMR